MVARGGAIVGTPDDAIAASTRCIEATGGFGGLFVLAHEWASREKTMRSYELFARYVAPQFQGDVAEGVKYSNDWARENRDLMFAKAVAGILTAAQDYAQHKAERASRARYYTQPRTRVRP